jgi:hypothetical protein
MTEIPIHVRADIRPTESLEKVQVAIRNIIGDIELHVTSSDQSAVEGVLEGLGSLHVLRKLLRRMSIKDAARTVFLKNLNGNALTFSLNKQAAYAGRISFHNSDDSSLGPIRVLIQGNVSSVVKFLCG